jgi:hypothetical protein
VRRAKGFHIASGRSAEGGLTGPHDEDHSGFWGSPIHPSSGSMSRETDPSCAGSGNAKTVIRSSNAMDVASIASGSSSPRKAKSQVPLRDGTPVVSAEVSEQDPSRLRVGLCASGRYQL